MGWDGMGSLNGVTIRAPNGANNVMYIQSELHCSTASVEETGVAATSFASGHLD